MNIKDVLTKEEIQELMQRSDWKALWEVGFTWGVIIASFAMVAIWPNVLTVIIALILLGGRQLALAILLHDSAHRALFKSKKVNIWVGQWLCAYPILNDAEAYRPYHLQHHNHTGSDLDPDIPLTAGYPARIKSFIRKVARDLSGVSGVRAYIAIILMHLGFFKFSLGGSVEKIDQTDRSWGDILKMAFRNLSGPILVHAIMITVFVLIGMWWLYLLWIGAMLSTGMLFARIRSIAEHSVVPDRSHPLQNTRTTYANWLERLLFAPHHVNYHLEHHLLMSVPSYNLPKMHQMLKERGFLEDACIEHGYWDIIKLAIAKPETVG